MKQIQWTDALRYRAYQDWPATYQASLQQTVAKSPWRTQTHIQPQTGLLNDPCSLNYLNGVWHFFYQQYPFGPVHGLKSWHHLTSTDLVHWQPSQPDILPDTSYDSHGVYTGSGYLEDQQLHFLYTGNVRDANWQRHAYQMHAYINADKQLVKDATPVIAAPPAGFTQEFRDPFVFEYEAQRYALIGGQRQDKTGAILLYRQAAKHDWQFVAPLKLPKRYCGYMVECPNIAFINGKVVLVFCPQGLDKSIFAYDNLYPNIALVADKFDPETGALGSNLNLQQLDAGFDFYATRLATDPAGQILAITWLGLPEIQYPTDEYGWAHVLSYPRILTLDAQDQVCLKPHPNLRQLRQQPVLPTSSANGTQFAFKGALELVGTVDQTQLLTITVPDDTRKTEPALQVTLDFEKGQGTLIRPANTTGGAKRMFDLPTSRQLTLHLFIDESVFEIFLADGRQVLSGRFFGTKAPETLMIKGISQADAFQAWQLQRSNQAL
ncbi:sucrose-6-phosphate hydrolase [Lactobacillus sp. CC-MHH1034]|uniref:sucrose-6-phosphate hydrolase n=1 Tax=Agrilactobacillus fermenti TaxID=2586909 RepID=UPI001E405B18|nr:sucrose-6-phosphate hydrolase [Agrilactobacillus fermenti]MCD2255126.1 sucrose-6-phosphate hydrolase [Agrilactobacillus fermenti]